MKRVGERGIWREGAKLLIREVEAFSAMRGKSELLKGGKGGWKWK